MDFRTLARLRLKRNINLFLSHKSFLKSWILLLLGFALLNAACEFTLSLKNTRFVTSGLYGILKVLDFISGTGAVVWLILPFFSPSLIYRLLGNARPFFSKSGSNHTCHSTAEENNIQHEKMDQDYLAFIGRQVETCMQLYQPYLRPDFNLTQLSSLLHIPVHHLAYYFREIKRQSICDFRNEWRVAYAKKLIEEGKANTLTLEAIGKLSGFESRITFYHAFKKSEGIPPHIFSARYLALANH